MKSLQSILRECVKKILTAKVQLLQACNSQNLYSNQEPEELASLYTFGSFRMMIHEPWADIDT